MRVAASLRPSECLIEPETTYEVHVGKHPPKASEEPTVVERSRSSLACRKEGTAASAGTFAPTKLGPAAKPPAPAPPPAPPAAALKAPEPPGFFSRLGGAIWGGLSAAGARVGGAVLGIVRDATDTVTGSVTGAVQSLVKAARHVGEGRIGQALLDVSAIPFNATTLALVKATSAVQTFFGIQQPSRPLKQDEADLLRDLFGPSLRQGPIAVVEGGSGLLNVRSSAITLGNTIHVSKVNSPISLNLLAHEAVHTWQNQNGGNDYLLKAFWAQKAGEGYNYHAALARGETWKAMNPEQQAEFVQDIVKEYEAKKLALPGVPPRLEDCIPAGATRAQVLEALTALRSGRGAGDYH